MKHRLLKRQPDSSGLTRRKLLGFMGGTATVTLLGCVRRPSTATSAATPSATSIATAPEAAPSPTATPGCVVRPQQTEGPYFVDDRLNRSDIRSDPADGSIRLGVPLRLVFQVLRVSGSACQPLSGATVDVWHCDAEGIYSDVSDRRFNTVGQKFLRGYQTTDANGRAEFITIYPGWYPGRTVHIHFKIRTAQSNSESPDSELPNSEFTSQLYFDDAITDRVQAQAPYQANGQRGQRNSQDGIFQRGGNQLLLQLTPIEAGYEGRFEIGLEMA